MSHPTDPVSGAAALHGAVRLTDWGVIRASGEDARRFLHGQLTQDIEHLAAGDARLAGYCSAKGRLLATFVVWPTDADTLLLACSADVLPAVLKRLTMFVLRAKCRLSDASAEVPLWGLTGDAVLAAAGSVPELAPWRRTSAHGADLIRLPDALPGAHPVQRWLWAGGAAPDCAALDPEAWCWLEVHSGVARVVAATVERFVPQMVNLELVGGVNFKKGCYPGQEVVARSQYRGTLKRRAQVVDSPVPLAPGQELFHDADPEQPAGTVVLAGRHPDGRYAALVEVKLGALTEGSLHLGAADGPLLTLTAQPVALPD